ncbi:MAG: hydroxylamine reductase [Kiritimatiellae bacterium]|nr:hydroxylamine reductase [Kiritimatiellia bacterium]
MNDNGKTMFCRQCQETFGNAGCTCGGACGKRPETAALMDELVAALEELAAAKRPTRELGRFVARSLFLTLTNANFDDARIREALAEAARLLGRKPARSVPGAFAETDPDARSVKELVLFGLKGVCAYAHHAAELGRESDEVYDFAFHALKTFRKERSAAELAKLALACGRAAVRAMALLDEANTAAYGSPCATEVSLEAGTRPGILVSGHDLRDLRELLEQTRGTGVDVYTHGEMLPAHYYPAFKRHPHLKGNYGGAWHRQQDDFAAFNGAILMTSNCIVPVRDAYRDRIFTTGVAGWPGVPHVPDRKAGLPKDFRPVIDRARRCAPPTPLETGKIVGGFAHAQMLAYKDRIVDAVRAGKIRKFVVMAGCDGRHASRDYYREVAEALPSDTVILTAGCAKYRYLKHVKGDVDGIPRVLDAGQCNDCYSIVLVAMALRDAFGFEDVNDLPLAFDIAWYEQKAVAVLLALLSLGFRNVRLGPTMPAFLSPNVARVLAERFGVCGINTPSADVRTILRTVGCLMFGAWWGWWG